MRFNRARHHIRHDTTAPSGFTLAELLAVVAVISVLVAVAIPVFNAQLEKSRRAVDMHTARCVETAVATAYSTGRISIDGDSSQAARGVWVMICRDGSCKPMSYGEVDRMENGGRVFCGSDPGVDVDGSASASWPRYSDSLERVLRDFGIDPSSLSLASSGGGDGWDWVIVEVGYVGDRLQTRIYSGYAGKTSSMADIAPGTTNIERQID